ncbi:MAG: trigger factor [Planctomycetaceae bacterium]|jgi:trigger factor|nr:trigger factor [Planctomycetaceae bacterium]
MSTLDTNEDNTPHRTDTSEQIDTPTENRIDIPMDPEVIEDLDMEIDIEVVSACERVVKIKVPRHEVDRYFAVQFDELVNYAHIPGFRQGKVPRSLVEKKYRHEVQDQVKRKLVSDAIRLVDIKIKLVPISEPHIDIDSYNLPDAGDFAFDFSIEVRPEFDLPEWKGLKIENPVRTVSGEDIDREVNLILAEYGVLIPVNTPVELDSFVNVSIAVELEGIATKFYESETLRVRNKLSFHDCVINNFAELVKGAKVSDKLKTKVEIKGLAGDSKVSGKTVDVTFEVLGVMRIELPELTPEILQRLGSYNDVADFKDAVLDKLKNQIQFARNTRTRQQVMKALSGVMNWELPARLLASQAEREFNRHRYELIQSGYTESYIVSQENLLRTDANNLTADALREHFVLEKIAEAEGITETEKDYHDEIAILADQIGTSYRRLRAHLEKTGRSDIIRNQVIERKVLQLISQHAEFVDVPYEFEQIDTTAMSWAILGKESDIQEVSEEDLKAVQKELEYKKNFDPNMRVT